MSQYEVLSVNVGKPREIAYQDKFISTAIWKTAIQHPVMLSSTNLAGDGQADLENHGGVDKAVMIYSHDHYDYWERFMGRELAYGSFGENITIAGLTERDVCIGDIFKWGEAIIQISQPRYPCYKLCIRHGLSEIPRLIIDTGFSGYYVRVLQSGIVSKEVGLHRLQQHPMGISVSTVSDAFTNKNTPEEVIRAILAVNELSTGWRRSFESRLA